MRTLLAATAATVLLAGLADAAPSAVVRDEAEAAITVDGTDGARYHLYVGAAGPGALGEPAVVTVGVNRCSRRGCARVSTSRFHVPPSAVTIAEDASAARLSTTYLGMPLEVTWAANDAYGPVGLQGWLDPELRTGVQRSADAVVTLGELTCSGVGAASRSVRAGTPDRYTPVAPRPLPAGFAPRDGASPRCVAPS